MPQPEPIAPLPPPRPAPRPGPREGNERRLLSLLRRQGALPGAEIARQSGLSAQTVSVILRRLEEDGLVARGAPQRGRVGQPSVPMSLDPDGAFFLGLKIGRRSSEMVLIDFLGRPRGRRLQRHAAPDPEATLDFADAAIAALTGSLPPALRPRVEGLGIAAPSRLWDWAADPGAGRAALEAWRGRDLRADLAARHAVPVYLENDATAACGAELVFGRTPLPEDFLHATIGSFVGGGLVLGGALQAGRRGNAGALGSMPVLDATGRRVQLIDLASLAALERALLAEGLPAEGLWQSPEAWDLPAALLARWTEGAADALAQALVAALSVVDVEALVIDGWLPASLRQRLVVATDAALARQNLAGLERPRILAGSLGPEARALGAAALPLAARYLA